MDLKKIYWEVKSSFQDLELKLENPDLHDQARFDKIESEIAMLKMTQTQIHALNKLIKRTSL